MTPPSACDAATSPYEWGGRFASISGNPALVRRRPAGLERRLDAAVARPDRIGRHRAHEGVEGLVADRIDHPLADQLRIDAGPQALRHDRLGGWTQLRAAQVIGAVARALCQVG